MKSKNKLIFLIISSLLLIPFRLPVSVLLIDLFNLIAQMGGEEIPAHILRANVTVTKVVYNLVLSSLMVYNLEMLSIGIKGKRATEGSYKSKTFYWWTVVIAILLFCYQIFDGYWTVELFNVINK